MKKFLFSIMALVCVLLMGSCVKSDYGYPPVYGKIIISPASPKAGDSITATIQVISPGNGILRGDYTWSLDGKSKEIEVVDPDNNEPYYRFVAGPGRHNISCKVKFRMSKPLASGQIASSATIQSSSFTVK